jgi:hypothetical protein
MAYIMKNVEEESYVEKLQEAPLISFKSRKKKGRDSSLEDHKERNT